MKRRNFIKQGIGAATAFSGAYIFGYKPAFGESGYDMAAVKGGEPAAMFDKAIEAMGGMSRYVKKNQRVVINPNIGWDASIERAANTNPYLIKRIIEHCFNAGAKDVYIFDHTCSNWRDAYESSGIERMAKEAGAKVVSGNSEEYYQDVSVPKGKILKNDKIHELILESHVYLNVPVLKHHGSGRLTIAMKNLMGINWDRRWWHRHGLHQCIADLPTKIKPDLNIVDAYRVMMDNGPRGVSTKDVVKMKSLIISEDILAVDIASAKLFGAEPMDIPFIRYGKEHGLGQHDLSRLKIKRIKM